MMIKSLELENIRSYRKEKIEFPEGVILFEGDIGSGKSTLLYAIEFALFGLGDLKSTYILRNGEKEGLVKLTAEIGGKDVVFQRILERKKTGASQKECAISFNGSKTEFSPEEMKREVLKMLNFNENPSPKATSYIYRYAVFTPQEAMKEILELPEDARLETLRRAFGIEEYRIARGNSSIVSKELKERENFIAGSLEDVDTLKTQRAEKSALAEKKLIELSDFTKKEKALENILSEKKKALDSVRAAKTEFDKLSGELPGISEALSGRKKDATELEKSIAGIASDISAKGALIKKLDEEKKPTEKSDEEITAELNVLREKITAISKSIGGLERSVSESGVLDKILKSADNDISAIEKKIAALAVKEKPTDKTDDALSGEIRMLRKQADELREKVAVMKDAAKKFEKLIHDEICPFCEQKIDPAHFIKKAESLNFELKLFEESLKETMSKEGGATKAKDLLAEFSRASETLSGLSKEREMILKNKDAAKAKLDEISAFRQTLSNNLSLLSKLKEDEARVLKISEGLKKYAMNRMQALEAMQAIDALQKRIEPEKKKLEALGAEISRISSEYESKKKDLEAKRHVVLEISMIEKEIQSLESERRIALSAQSSAGAEMRVLESDLKSLSEMLSKKELEKKEKERLYETRAWLDEYFSNALASIEQHVLRSINEEFNSLFQKWFGIIMVDTDLSVSINDAFTPFVVQNGYEQDIHALSGGEKTSVALAYRLALNTVVKRVCSSMNSSGLIILDEPTDGFSKEQLNHLRDVFRELSCRQIILVSHERELEAFSDRVFRIVKEGSVSKVSGV